MNNQHNKARALTLLAVTALAVALVTGCKPKGSEVVGSWKDTKGTTITFNEDKSFSQVSGTMTVTGKWSLDNKKLNVSVEKFGGKSADETLNSFIEAAKKGGHPIPADKIAEAKKSMTMALTLSEDGKTITVPSVGGMPAQTLTKVETAK